MEIRHLITFKAVIDFGGFTKAASHLGYAQSSITSHIKTLEEELERPLFDRIGKKVVLTETGEKLIPYVEEMLELYKEIKRVAVNNEITGTITIAASEVLMIYRFPEIIKEFKKNYPGVTIKWRHLDPLTFKQELSNGEVDLCFMLSKPLHDKNLDTHKLTEERMMFVYPEGHKFNDFKELDDYITFFTEKGCSYRLLLEDFILEKNILPKSTIESWSVETIKQAVINGIGISMLPYISLENELNNNQLHGIEYKVNPGVGTYLVFHKDKWVSPVAEKFIETVEEFSSGW